MKLQLVAGLLMMALLLSVQRSDAAVDHGPWSRLLARYVDAQGRVAYRDLQTHDRAAFDAYLATLAQAQTDGMTEAEEKALWINAYNALIVSGVLQGIPVKAGIFHDISGFAVIEACRGLPTEVASPRSERNDVRRMF